MIEGTGKDAIAAAEPYLSLIPPTTSSQQDFSHVDQGNLCHTLLSDSHDVHHGDWLLDSGATDHMTFDPVDLSHHSSPRRTSIANANGMISPVTGAGSMTLLPSLHLSNTLLVPSLSHKLLSVSQITTELNCVVLMFSNFCLIQDILPKEIIGHGTKKGGLYYMEDFSLG